MIDTAVYDACVLYSASLRDFLLRLGNAELVLPVWSNRIHEEWIQSLLQNRPDLSRERLERTRRKMDTEFPYSLISGFEEIIPSLHLPDPKDRHVLAVAIHAEAKYIVTFNLKDFPKTALAPYQVEAILPDNFVSRVIKYDAGTFLTTVAQHRVSLTRPPKSAEEYLATLEKQGLYQTVKFLREHKSEI
ncbi:MAG: PIN domain-containing protein [Planctomycetaceae bacterium]|nr:PIN domain-containing protein [Planctomycetaceae bacterium]